jgi:hypothetical protein
VVECSLSLWIALRFAFAKRSLSCRWSEIGHCLCGLGASGVVVVVYVRCGIAVGLVIWARVVSLLAGLTCLSSNLLTSIAGRVSSS